MQFLSLRALWLAVDEAVGARLVLALAQCFLHLPHDNASGNGNVEAMFGAILRNFDGAIANVYHDLTTGVNGV